MSFKVLFRCIVFLAILFVLLYIGSHNRQTVDFNFPILLDKKWTDEAGIVYFVMFAAGVLAGALLTAGTGGKARSKNPSKGDK
jgi:uncharacterized membrane protein YciS (DUF1049 family)